VIQDRHEVTFSHQHCINFTFLNTSPFQQTFQVYVGFGSEKPKAYQQQMSAMNQEEGNYEELQQQIKEAKNQKFKFYSRIKDILNDSHEC